ncbi:hypothetical protein [Phenylobacterium sp.]|uniref:hypothetical protein n=1 Tax=Phenylobacterium sp. TaxID=1871053 RepID=UPI0035AE8EF3
MDTDAVWEATAQSPHAGPVAAGDSTACDPRDAGVDCDRESRQWTIKGLPPATVEVTREAAKRSGMRLNSFVSLALERAAADAMPGKPVGARLSEVALDDLNEIKSQLAQIREKGEQLESTINSISAILLKLYTEKP